MKFSDFSKASQQFNQFSPEMKEQMMKRKIFKLKELFSDMMKDQVKKHFQKLIFAFQVHTQKLKMKDPNSVLFMQTVM